MALAGLTGLVVLGFLRATLLPGLAFWDTGEAQTVPPLLGTMHAPGFPAYAVTGWLASIVLQPFGTPAFRMNLFSALLVSLGAGATVLVLRRLGVPAILGAVAGLGFASTPLVWKLGVGADAHTLHGAILVLLVLLLVSWQRRVALARDDWRSPASAADRWLLASAALFGYMAANHSLTLLLVPAVGAFVLAVQPDLLGRPRFMARAVLLAVGVMALFYLELPLRAGLLRAPLVYAHPDTLDGFIYVVFAVQFHGGIVDPFGDLPGKLASLANIAWTELGPVAWLVPIAFIATAWRQPRYALLSGIGLLVTCFFSLSYIDADIGRYYQGPAFFAWTWVAILGGVLAQAVGSWLGWAWAARRRVRDGWRAQRRGVGILAVIVAIALIAPTGAALPDRLRTLDRSEDRAAVDWISAAYREMGPNAIVLSWWSYSTPLWYGQLVEGRRPDVWIIDDRTRLDLDLGELSNVIDPNLGRRPVYVIRETSAALAAVAARYELEPVPGASQLYRVVGLRSGVR